MKSIEWNIDIVCQTKRFLPKQRPYSPGNQNPSYGCSSSSKQQLWTSLESEKSFLNERGKYEYVLLSPVTVVHITEQMDVKSEKYRCQVHKFIHR